MNYKQILESHQRITSITVRGCSVTINKTYRYTYKFPSIAQAVAKKLQDYINI
nr:MAG TPA: hypothetical protein [Caudoviricetes sp.]